MTSMSYKLDDQEDLIEESGIRTSVTAKIGRRFSAPYRYLAYTNSDGVGGPAAVVVLAVMAAAFVLNIADRQMYAVLTPGGIRCREGLNINSYNSTDCIQFTDTQQGLLFGPAFTGVFTFSGLFFSNIGSLLARKWWLILGLTLWSSALIGAGFVNTYTGLLIMRMLLGAFESVGNPNAYSLISEYFPPERRASAFSTYSLSVYVAFGLAFLSSSANSTIGWRHAFFVWGAPGFLVALVILVLVKEPKSKEAEQQKTEGTKRVKYTFFQVLARIRKNRQFMLVCLAAAIRNFAGFSLIAWLASLYDLAFDQRAHSYGPIVGLIIVFGGSTGALSGGYLSDRLGKRFPAARAMVIFSGQLVAAPCAVGVILAEQVELSYVCFAATVVFGDTWLGPAAATIQELVSPDMRVQVANIQHQIATNVAQANAVYLSTNTFIGGLGPLAVGAILQHGTKDAGGIRHALLYTVPPAYFLTSMLWLIIGFGMQRQAPANLNLNANNTSMNERPKPDVLTTQELESWSQDEAVPYLWESSL